MTRETSKDKDRRNETDPGFVGTHEGIWHSTEDPTEAETRWLWQERQT